MARERRKQLEALDDLLKGRIYTVSRIVHAPGEVLRPQTISDRTDILR
jgi:hypothetical protein